MFPFPVEALLPYEKGRSFECHRYYTTHAATGASTLGVFPKSGENLKVLWG